MLKHILPLIPSHSLYTEAFCGGCAVLFAKPPSAAEIINDLNRELINFYWVAQVYYSDLKQEIDSTLHARDTHAHAEHLCQRLGHVTIESRDALEVIECYDRPTAFHFVDPPYVGSDCGHYAGAFGDADLERLLQLLERICGKFMLTMFPNDTIAQYADRNGWHIHRIERTISASKESRRRQQEWIVCNYLADGQQQLF